MKKIIALFSALLLTLSVTACTNDAENTETTAETSIHTLPPTEIVTDEYEWAEIDCVMTVADMENNIYAYPEDFETFAVVGSNDADSYIIVKVSDEATAAINAVADKSHLCLLIGGDTFGDVSYGEGEFTGEIELGHSMTFEEVCNLATTIRGLFD